MNIPTQRTNFDNTRIPPYKKHNNPFHTLSTSCSSVLTMKGHKHSTNRNVSLDRNWIVIVMWINENINMNLMEHYVVVLVVLTHEKKPPLRSNSQSVSFVINSSVKKMSCKLEIENGTLSREFFFTCKECQLVAVSLWMRKCTQCPSDFILNEIIWAVTFYQVWRCPKYYTKQW